MKKISQHTILKILWGIILLLLLLPNIQSFTKIFFVPMLHGTFLEVENPQFNWQDWTSGEFQAKGEAYRKANFDFRSSFVRLHNQIDWSLFRGINVNDLIEGKDGYLFMEDYIKANLGIDAKSIGSFQVKAFKVKRLQDTLKHLGIDLIVALAPGKASYFPEYFPDKYKNHKRRRNNYERIVQSYEEEGVAYIDFMKWFLEMKDTSSYPLFPKCGTHWSHYGEFLAADSLVNYIEKLKKKPIPRMVLDSIVIKAKNAGTEHDLWKLMNIFYKLPTYPMGKPHFHIEKNDSSLKLNVIAIADSYFGPILEVDFARDIFEECQYWKYNLDIYQPVREKVGAVIDLNLKEEVEKQDVIILLATELNFADFPFDFAENLYPIYFPEVELRKERIAHYLNEMRNSPGWMKSLQQKAKDQNMTLEEMMRIDAEFLFKTQR